MNKETKQKIDNIVEGLGLSETAKKTLRDLITSVYIDGEIAGLDKAKEIFRS